jgi:hypothetical protein
MDTAAANDLVAEMEKYGTGTLLNHRIHSPAGKNGVPHARTARAALARRGITA